MTQAQALDILKTGVNVFLTGEPGSGKTYTINAYVRWLKSHGIQPAITASTGIAATHIGGMTIHSFAGIGIADFLSKYDIQRIAGNEKVAHRILATSVLIIDEVSMLDANKLQMVEAICKEVRNSEMPFGGIQVVLVGDFFQLPPIASEGQQAVYAFDSQTWQALNPVVCYLTEQYRQDDQIYLDLLNAIRRNSFEQRHHEIMATRHVAAGQAELEIPKLFSHNVDVDRINSARLAKLPGDSSRFEMRSKGRKALVDQLMRGCLSPEILELKQDAVVMFTKNSQLGKFVNGTLGVVAGFEKASGLPMVKIKNGPKLTVGSIKWSFEDRGQVKASIEQIPLRLAWAITIHKSQGMSMDAAMLDLSEVFEYGQGYVALSRVRRLSGLHLLGINQKALMVHPEILAKDEEFRGSSLGAEGKLRLLSGELSDLHEKFIRACGGKIKENIIDEKNEPAIGFDKIRATYPNAYRPWDDQQDLQLRNLFGENQIIADLAKIFGRKPGAIKSRLVKLGLMAETTST